MLKKFLFSCLTIFLCGNLLAAPTYSEEDGIIISYEQKNLLAEQQIDKMSDSEKSHLLKTVTDMFYSKEFVDQLAKEIIGAAGAKDAKLSSMSAQKISTGKDNPLIVITSIMETRHSKLILNFDKQGMMNMIMCIRSEENNTTPISLTSGPCAKRVSKQTGQTITPKDERRATLF